MAEVIYSQPTAFQPPYLISPILCDIFFYFCLHKLNAEVQMQNAIRYFGADAVMEQITHYANIFHVPDSLHIEYVGKVCCQYPDLAPDFNGSKKKNKLDPEQCVEQWVKKFLHGYLERISLRTSKMPGTIPDNAIVVILQSALTGISLEQAKKIVYAHRLGMSAENILGLLLEEFLFEMLSPVGWAMAWGETIKHVDFCNEEGCLLQIKNRSNSENSSSSKIRDGKPIDKWFRINATTGRCEWEALESIVGHRIADLNEESFQCFIKKTLANNPSALAIESNNPWGNLRS